MADSYDLAIIGAGPGGYVAAIRAAQLGLKTVCLDQRPMPGGTCLNVGCIPSKTLLQATELLDHLKRTGKEQGIECTQIEANFPQMMARKNQVVKSLVEGVSGLFKQDKVTYIQGHVKFLDAHHLQSDQEGKKQEIEAQSILIATGSAPIALPFLPFDERQIVSSTGALDLKRVPQRLTVIGGGVIGVELASVYSRLGSQVTVVEMLDHICPALDATLSKQLLQLLQKQGITFLLSTQVMSAVVQPDEVILTLAQKDKLQNHSAEVVLVAVGRRPYTDDLELERIGIQRDAQGFIPVDAAFRTTQPHVFAIGDVIRGTMLAHKASAEGISVVDSLKGIVTPVNYLAIPNVVYTHPEVACVGLTEQEAVQAGIKLQIGKSFFRGNSRARCSDETDGLVKILGDQASGRLVGMHIIGAHASEIISEGMLAMQKQATVADIADAAQAHPTLSEAVKEAALDALGRAINQ